MRNPIRTTVVCIGLVFGGLAASPPQTYDKGVRAYNCGDYKRAVRLWLPLARQGDALAQFNLGMMSQTGRGVLPDYVVAAGWYQKAADQGLADAQSSLGAMYEKGEGVPQDYALAVFWLRKAAESGLPDAEGQLGLMYENGRGVAQDYVQALKWSNLAAAGFPPLDERRDLAVRDRDRVAAKMTPEEVTEAQRQAREWAPQ